MQSLHTSRNLRYLVMPDFVYEDDRLSPIALKIYCFIHTFKGEYFFFSSEHLAKMFNCDERSVKRGFAQLKELKYIDTQIEIKAGGGRRRFVTDLFRGDKNVPSEGTKMTPLSKLDEGTDLSLDSEANTALPNDNSINDNNLSKNFEKEEKTETQTEFKSWLEAKREKKKNKGKFGFIPVKGNPKQYIPEFNQRRKGGINALDVV